VVVIFPDGYGAALRTPFLGHFLEVYPHPGMVELFGLTKTLKYKACPERPYPLLWAELGRLRDLLRSLSTYEPALDGSSLLDLEDPHGPRGRALKRAGDLLDALFCAYTALHIWYWGEEGYRCFGDLETGYILVPVRPSSVPEKGGRVEAQPRPGKD
jgi:predicted RNase H-like nuclease